MSENVRKLTKRVVDAAKPRDTRYEIWDAELKGFGIRIEASGTKTYIVRYRPKGTGAKGAKRFVKIGRHGHITPEQARESAKGMLGAVALGEDPARELSERKRGLTVEELTREFTERHVKPKLAPATVELYDITFRIYVLPRFAKRQAADLTQLELAKLHAELRDKKPTANRVMNYLSKMYNWAVEHKLLPSGTNPAAGIKRYEEVGRETYLRLDELERLGNALRLAETTGVPWQVDETKPKAKHAPRKENQVTRIAPQATAAIRLLLLTGARLREVLHLRWEWVDLDRGLLLLPTSKTGKKTIVLNAPAMALLSSLPRMDPFVFPGRKPGKPLHDLKKPWEHVRRMADLPKLRLHDLRHTHASFGVGAGLGLPVVGKLLGHTQVRTTERYAHVDADPLRRASNSIGSAIAAALDGKSGEVVPLHEHKRQA
jgi:integrase